MNLIENTAIKKLPVMYQEFVRAKINNLPIQAITNYDLETALKNIILVSYQELGLRDSVDSQVATFLRQTLFNDFRKPPYSNATVQEIQLFVSKGLRGDYGTFKGQLNVINVQNIHHWVKAGLADKTRIAAMEEFNRKLDEQLKSSVPVKLTKEALLASAKGAFKDYKESGKLPFVPHAIYDTIKELSGLKTLINSSEWPAIQQEAKANLEKRHKSKRGEKSVSEILNMESRTFEFEVKRIGLQRFFDNLITEGKTLEI